MKSEISRNLLLLAAALAALAAGYFAALWWLRAPAVDTAPGAAVEFRLPDLDGRERGPAEWRGRVLVLNFWATWCPPCREEIPLFIALQKQHGTEGLQFLGVALDEPEAVRQYVVEMSMNYPTLLGSDDALELMERYGNRSGSLPYSVVFDRGGRIVARKLGAFKRTDLESLLSPLLTGDNAEK